MSIDIDNTHTHVVNLVSGIFVRAYRETVHKINTSKDMFFGYNKSSNYDSASDDSEGDLVKVTPWGSDFHYGDRIIKYCGDFEYYKNIFTLMSLSELNDMMYLLLTCMTYDTKFLEQIRLIIDYIKDKILIQNNVEVVGDNVITDSVISENSGDEYVIVAKSSKSAKKKFVEWMNKDYSICSKNYR